MMTDAPPTKLWRTILAFIVSLCVGALSLVLWYRLKLAAMSTWSETSIFFMPLLIGVAVGWAARLCTSEGTRNLASFATLITLVAGVSGLTLQHRLEIDFFLKRIADVTFDETLNCAKRTVAIKDPDALRREMSTTEISVIGRIVARETFPTDDDFWFTRNFAHLHWVASRQITTYGEGGPKRIIFEASRILKNRSFFDQIVSAYANEPITDADISNFFTFEQPFLNQLTERKSPCESFEEPLVKTVWANIDWPTLVGGGFGPLSGICLVLGCCFAYKITRRPSDVEVNYSY